MKKQTTPIWVGGLTAAAAALLFFWRSKGQAVAGPVAPALQLKAPTPEAPATDGRSTTDGLRKPTPDNGHIRDVVATDLPAGDTGSNFSAQGDVHEPTETQNKP